MATTTLFPLQYRRQDAVPVDEDLVFQTTAARTAYLTNARRYGGMIVADLEAGRCYFLNAARDTWIPVAQDPQVITYTASQSMLPSHFGNIISMNLSSPGNYTVTETVGQECPAGTTVVIGWSGSSQVTIVQGSNAVLRTPETLTIRKQHGKITLQKMVMPNIWDLEGNLTAA